MLYIMGTQINCEENFTGRQFEIISQADFFAGFSFSLQTAKKINTTAEFYCMNIYDSLKEENIEHLISVIRKYKNPVIMVSGNPLMFSYTKNITAKLLPEEYEVLVSPSSVDYLAQKTKTTLNGLCYVSGHNSHNLQKTYNEVLFFLNMGRPVAYFVKNREDFSNLSALLGKVKVNIAAGFELGSPQEKVLSFESQNFPDFIHGRWILILQPVQKDFLNSFPKNSDLNCSNIPVSREWTRFLCVNSLNRQDKHDIIWDLGAGSGATSIYISSFYGRNCSVKAIEKDKNRFGHLVENTSLNPEILCINEDFKNILRTLDKPDIVHLGGGIDRESLLLISQYMPKGSVLICSAATQQSLCTVLQSPGYAFEYSMYAKFSSNNISNKDAFKGEYVFYCIRGEKID